MSLRSTADGKLNLSGIDAASYVFHTRTGLAKLCSIFYLFCCCLSVTADETKIIGLIQKKRDARFVKSYLIHERRITPAQPSPTFNTFPKQRFRNDCGAQSLRQAAYELGITQLPKNDLYSFRGQPITDDSAEETIYNITGNLLNDAGNLRIINPEDGGYSYPANMLKCANLIGLDGRFYCSSLLPRIYMSTKYAKEWAETWEYAPIHFCCPPDLYNNERLLVVVNKGSVLHYIMQRPDKTCYAPDSGNSYQTLEEYTEETQWKPSGISILISNPAGYPKARPSTVTARPQGG